jgi:type III secretion protein C
MRKDLSKATTARISRTPVLHTLLFVAACVLCLATARAAEPRWPEEKVALQAQEQPLGEFLRELLRSAGLQGLPSDAVNGRISGRFSDSPEKIFNNVVKAYDLLPYYDGSVMHIASGKELQSKSIRVPPADMERVARALNESKLADRYQSVQVARGENLVKVRGAPEFVSNVQQLIQNNHRPAIPRATAEPVPDAPQALVVRSFPLKYASAADQTFYQSGQEMRIPGVVTLLRSMTGNGAALIPAAAVSDPRSGGSRDSVRGKGLRRFDRQEVGYGDERSQGAPSRRDPIVPTGEQTSGARIEADPNLNTVLVRDYENTMPMYQELIAQLDKEPQLVEIQVTIIDIDRTKLNDVGVDWRFQDGRSSISAGGGDPGAQNGGLILNTVLGDARNFMARVHALARTGQANVISRPQVLTLSNLEAVLATDQSFFVRVAGNEDVDLFDVSVGTSLRVVPTVAGDASNPQIRLRVGIEDGSLSPDAQVDNIPIVERSSLNTQAVIFDGQSLLLGGLTRDETTKDTTKVPLLGDVPGVGKLFRRTTSVTSSQERLFLISPRIIASNHVPVATPPRPPVNPQPGVTAGAAASIPRRDSGSAAQPAQGYLDGF